MKLAEHNNSLKTNVKATTQNFGIGDASVVIEILRNRLYEHKIRTLVQEYMCNGRDAMREVGNKNPIDVYIPTRFQPTFKVRDYGPGITPERMETVFVMYGASTKRGDNLQTGGYGIGAKSAWSYTDSFTIVTYVDGTKRTYVAHTGVNNNGRLDLISTEKTDEPNGTEIQVAAKVEDISEFSNAVFRASYFWDVKPNYKGILDAPQSMTKVYDVWSKNFVAVSGGSIPWQYQLGQDNEPLAVIDGVPYVLSYSLCDRVPKLRELIDRVRSKAILYFPNGVLEVSASREKVADSKQTLNALEKHASASLQVLHKLLTDEFKKSKDVHSFLTCYRTLSQYFDVGNWANYKGYSINYNGTIKHATFDTVVMQKFSYRGKKLITRQTESFSLEELSRVYQIDVTESAIQTNKRIRQGLQNSHTLIVIGAKPDDAVSKAGFDTLVKDLEIQGISTIPLPVVIKQPRVKVSRDNKEFCLHTFNDGSRFTYTTLAKNTTEYLYVELKDGTYNGYLPDELRDLDYYLKTHTDLRVCGVADRAINMVKGNANFKPLKKWIEAFAPSKSDVAEFLKLNAKHVDIVGDLRELNKLEKLEDPAIADIIGHYEVLNAVKNPKQHPKLIANIVKTDKECVRGLKKDEDFGKWFTPTYPLFQEVGYYNRKMKKDLAFYLNAKYNSINSKKGN